MTSHGSTAAASEAEGPPKPAELDALEAEIETIKADIQILRVGAESMHQTDILHNSDRQSDLSFRVEGSKIPAPISRQSAAKTGGGGSKRGEVKALCSKTTTASPNINNPHFTPTPHSTQPSPHFAQPTQAATRRVHQTLRKDASPVKASPELSPNRSTKAKAPDFATDKRAAQRHQKRTSLPPTWTMSTPPMSESGALKYHPGDLDHTAESEHLTMPPPNMTGSGTPSTTNAQPADQAPSNSTKENAIPAKSSSAKLSQRNPMLRNKTSSYMSPTASAQRRSRVVDTTSRDARNARLNTKLKKKADELAEVMAMSQSALAAHNRAVDSEEAEYVTRSRQDGFDMFQSPLADYNRAADYAEALHATRSHQERGTTERRPPPMDFNDLPGSAMRLPMPLPHVANTVVTHQGPDHNLLDPIKEKLGREDLLRRAPAHVQPATNAHHGSQNDILNPVLAHMNMQNMQMRESMGQTIMVANAQPPAELNDLGHSPYPLYDYDGQRHASESRAAQDNSNEPISRLVSGLRGQSSANIGRALGGQQPSDPVTSDPAVLYQGPKPSSTIQTSTYSGQAPQSSSLRATAMIFVPVTELAQINTSQERGPSYLTYDQDFISGETPTISPVSDASFGGLPVPVEQASTSHLNDISVGATHAAIPWLNVERPPMLEPGFLEFHSTINNRDITAMTDTHAPWVNSAEIARRIEMHERYGTLPIAARQTPTFTSMPSAPIPAVSSPENLRSTPQWEIQGEGRRSYQWTGGDGREISFRGIGPDAEHDPNRPVEYRDLRTNTATVYSPRHHGASSTSPPTAPRSMREQAKRMSDSQVPRADDQQEGK
jgi:hypothetical protein